MTNETARQTIEDTFDRIDVARRDVDDAIFIAVADRDRTLASVDGEGPLAGLTFAVKDNIDVAGMATTAGCPSFGFQPAVSATVVARLTGAGATCVAKTNLDQFATGLVGTRSPYGIPINPVDARLVPGGSSSGSAVAVARGLVDFALGTDTAGSGRVPALHNRIVGLKPTRGLLSTAGVVPAVRSIDCVSIFARDISTAWSALEQARGFDASDPFSRRAPTPPPPSPLLRVAVPSVVDLDTDLDRAAWEEALASLRNLAIEVCELDISFLCDAGDLLYGGPWVAERLAAVGDFLRTEPVDADPTVARIILGGDEFAAIDAYRAQYQLAHYKQRADALWHDIDVLLVPTAPGLATLDEVAADPVGRNTRLGRYTNWVNLLDQCAIAVPGPDRTDGLPFGVTVIGPAGADATIASLAADLVGEHLSAAVTEAATGWLDIAVVGAHLTGQPLNWQLTDPGARLVTSTVTAASYRLYALANSQPPKPGLVHVDDGGAAIEIEIWRMPRDAVGGLLARIPAPLGLGTLQLADGRTVHGFIAEPRAIEGADDITHFGGWRAYLASR